MNHVNVGNLSIRISNFAIDESSFDRAATSSVRLVAEQLIAEFVQELANAARDFNDAKMENGRKRMADIHRHVVNGRMDPAALTVEARNAKEAVIHELKQRRFIRIALDRRTYLDRDDLFGPSVTTAFPSAKDDIKAAGNCLATECTTAAVFHAMCAAEVGLRVLGYDRRVQIFKNRATLLEIPLELATWEQIIKELEIAETAIQGFPQTRAREDQFEFYHGAMMQYRRFKNVFRNRLMHYREDYDRDQAKSAVDQVGEFMKILATKLKEGEQTPVIWP